MPRSRLDHPAALDDLLLYRMSRVFAVAGSLVIRLCEGRFGITRREWRLIALLADEGGLLSSELAARAQLDRARTSRAITSLVQKGLVARQAGSADRRQARVSLTARGHALHDELFPLVREINRELLRGLPPADVQRLARTLDQLQAQADALVAGAHLPKADRRRGGRAPLVPG